MARARKSKQKPIPSVGWKFAAPGRAFGPLYKPLGLVAVTFADLEQMLALSLATLLQRPYAEVLALEALVQGLTSRIQFFYFLATEATIELAKSKPEHKTAFDGMRKSARMLFENLMQAQSDRNNLLHGPWTGVGTGVERSFSKDRFSARDGKLKEIPMRGITVKILSDEARYFMSLRIRLYDWRQRMSYSEDPGAWPAPLPDKFLLQSPLQNLIARNTKKDL